jgi:hypothetical protein
MHTMNRGSRAGAEPASPTFGRSRDISGAKPGNHDRRFKGALSDWGGPCQVIANSADLGEERPPLSRWHPDYAEAFAAFVKKES